MSITPLEKRTAGLELALEQTASFGESILGALRGMLERLGALEEVLEQNTTFNTSLPNILREITERVVALEQALKEEATSGESSEKALMEFSRRMDALKQSIPKILESPAPQTGTEVRIQAPPAKTAEPGGTLDPAIPGKLREASERIAALEAAITRLSAQIQGATQNTGQSAAPDSGALGTLRDALKSVIDRMSMIEASAMRLSTIQPAANLNPALLDPIRDTLKGLADRINILETKPGHPPSATGQEAGFSSSFLETLRKMAERIGNLEAKTDWAAPAHASDESLPGTAQLLAKASRLYPKSKTVVFVGAESFSDNIKYAYLAFCAFVAGKDIAASFLCSTSRQYEQIRAAGLPCISPLPSEWSPENAKTLISAKVVVLDDNFHPHTGAGPIPHALLQGAKFIQLWHGIPFKEIGLQNLFSTRGGSTLLADSLASCGPFDVMIAPAVASRREWERWFSFREFAPLGLPRTDVFFQNLTPHDHINVDEKTLGAVQAARGESKRVVLYAPTFRDHNPGWFEDAGLEALATHCRDRGWLLYVNLHPREQGAVDELRAHHPNINFVAPGTDIYPIAKFADCLVTDYSSLAFDFLYADKPVVFYRPDHADYTARARALVPNHESLVAGPMTSSVESLIAAVADVFDRPDMDMFRDARLILRKKLFDYQDGKSGARLCAIIQRHLEPGIRFVPVVS